jgi:hypothetical protein
VLWAAFFNFIAFLFFGLHVAETLGTGIIDRGIVTPQVIFAALMGAIVWNIVTWIFGIPSSSSHALVGGLVGAGLAKTGTAAIVRAAVHRAERRRLLQRPPRDDHIEALDERKPPGKAAAEDALSANDEDSAIR